MNISKPKFYDKEAPSESKSETSVCALCFDQSPNAVLMECGHGGICYRCGIRLVKLKEKCPLCRESVDLILKIDIISNYGNFVKVIDSIDSFTIIQSINSRFTN